MINPITGPVAIDSPTSGNSSSIMSVQPYYDSALAHSEYREDTAIRRAVNDMKAAGINPILGFTGTGASSSSASSALGSSNISANAHLKAQQAASLVSFISSALAIIASVI